MSVRVGFLTSLGVNVGDEFIREGVRAILDHTGIPYRPFYINKVDSRSVRAPAEDEPEILADKFWDADVFVQAGAPVYWHLGGGRETSLTSRWHDWMWERRILRAAVDRTGPLFLNLGAGSCDPWGGIGDCFLGDAQCADFARAAGRAALVTAVRDPVASRILRCLDVAHEPLPCPAFLAGARRRLLPQASEVIGVNLMPLGGHYDLAGGFDQAAWAANCHRLCDLLRRIAPVWFVCHDQAEREFCSRFAAPGERVFLGSTWRDYLDAYAQCATVVANRVHGAVCAAGLGVPGVIMGTDTRAQIGDFIGIPAVRSGDAEADDVADLARDRFSRRVAERDRLCALRDQTLRRYTDLVAPVMRWAVGSRPGHARPAVPTPVTPRLATVDELSSGRFAGFMADVNAFAAPRGLRQFTNWSKVWEYPWLWSAVLGKLDWRGKRLVDLGTELSPLPWVIARLGAHITLVETHSDLVPTWDKLRSELDVQADFKEAGSERLPLPDASADVVTSFSVIEHQPDKQLAIDEVVRVLKPGGIFAVSFDVCEPAMGMSFPEWNGRALTMREFEQIAWNHPAFANTTAPCWNTADIPAYIQWHRQSAPHHNYATGAAVLIKKR